MKGLMFSKGSIITVCFTVFNLFVLQNIVAQKAPPLNGFSINQDNPFEYLFTQRQHANNFDPLYKALNNQRNREDDLIFVIDTAYDYSILADPKRYLYTYSEQGNRLSTLYQGYSNNEWQNVSLTEFTYDQLGNKIFEIWKSWVNNSWINASQATFIYSGDNNLIYSIKEIWNNGTWENDERNSFLYNVGGQVVSHVKEIWDTLSWVNNSKSIYTYDELGNMTYVLGELWQNDVWINDKQYSYNYSDNNLISGLYETWQNGEWQNVAKDSSVYNDANNRIMYLYKTWDDSAWINNFKYDYTYDDLDYLETSTLKTWDDEWINSERTQFSYGAYAEIESKLQQVWSTTEWADNSLFQYTYDDNGNALEGNYYSWEGIWTQNQDNVIQITYNYNTKMEAYFGYHVHAAYSSMLVGIKENIQEVSNITFGPNPTKNTFLINFSVTVKSFIRIDLYTLSGEKIYSVVNKRFLPGYQTIQLNTMDLAAGSYMVKLSDSNHHQKIIKLVVVK